METFLCSSFLFPLSILALSIYFLFKWSSSTHARPTNPPPSPQKLPIIGNLHQLGAYPHHSLRSLSNTHGPIMLLHFGNVPSLIVSSPEAAREIMKTHDLIFASRPQLSIFKKLLYNCRNVATAPYGEYWRQVRSICVLHLLSHKRVQSFRPVREEETALMTDRIRAQSSSSLMVNLSEEYATFSNNVISRVVLGRKYGRVLESGRSFKELFEELVELMSTFNVGDFIPWLSWVSYINGFDAKVDKGAKEMDHFLDNVVEEHIMKNTQNTKNDGRVDQQDFADVLLRIQRENTSGFALDRTSIKAVIQDMFAGGTDTTYSALEWTMAELLRHPEILKKLQTEVRRIGKGKMDITEDDLEKMHYLKAVIKETLRLHPPTPLLLTRESSKDVKVMGYDIAAGTRVIINAWAIGRDPGSWQEAEEFKPERFLSSSVDFKGHDFQLIPFGAGRRGCPGILFATTVIQLVLANVVNKFDLAVPEGENLDMTESSGFTTHRKFPLLAVATPL